MACDTQQCGDVVRLNASGSGNMGTVSVTTSVARFGLRRGPFRLAYIKGLWSGGSSSATMTVKLYHPTRNTRLFFHEFVFPSMGTGGNDTLDLIIPVDERERYTYPDGAELVPEWTNPNTQGWGLEFGLVPVAAFDHA